MAEQPKAVTIQTSVTVGVTDTTLKTITDTAASVNAPAKAVITTGGYFAPQPDAAYNFSINFTWQE